MHNVKMRWNDKSCCRVAVVVFVHISICFLSSGSYRGLLNQGATCYLNATLQVLFMTPAFRDRVLLLLVLSSCFFNSSQLFVAKMNSRTEMKSTRLIFQIFQWHEREIKVSVKGTIRRAHQTGQGRSERLNQRSNPGSGYRDRHVHDGHELMKSFCVTVCMTCVVLSGSFQYMSSRMPWNTS